MRATINDVARQSGVSITTVSRVLNDRAGVSTSTAVRVRQVMRRLEFEPSLAARSLRSARAGVVGLLVAEFDSFSCEILQGASAALATTEYGLLALTSRPRSPFVPGWEQRGISALGSTLIDGLIIVAPTMPDPRRHIPVVAIEHHARPEGMATVDSDSFAGAVRATRHLVALGHERVGFLGGSPEVASSRLREAGFRSAMAGAGIEVDPRLVAVGGFRRELAVGPAIRMLSARRPPTAIFAANDLSALGVMDAAARLGVRVPDELSVVGYDDIPEAGQTHPPLTTVSQPLRRMGAEAVLLLLRLLGADPPTIGHVHLPTELVARGSSAPPRPAAPEAERLSRRRPA